MIEPGQDNLLVKVDNLRTWFPVRGCLFRKRFVRAVDGVSLSIPRGKTLAVVGESGSGKTTLGRTILRLIQPVDGRVFFDGIDILSLPNREIRRLRRRMQIIFQDPVSSLNPRMTVGSIISEPLKVHRICDTRRERGKRVAELLLRVGLEPSHAARYPHEFSGGQRQRVGIARALASQPDFIVCDEPVSALDVSVQAQILNLLKDLQDEYNFTYLLIAHNLAVVEHFADVVAVMYLGKIVELADRDELYANPVHPYTVSLLSAVPRPEPNRRRTRVVLTGEMPSPINPPTGCAFHPRCPLTRQVAAGLPADETVQIISQGDRITVVKRCVEQAPSLAPMVDNPQHYHACHLKNA